MSESIVPNRYLKRHQRQEQVEGEESNRSSHVLNHNNNHNHNQLQNPSPHHRHLGPMDNYEVAELTWENGQLAMHGFGGLLHSGPIKPIWPRANETLESIVHQATHHKQDLPNAHHHRTPANISSTVASSDGKWNETAADEHQASLLMKKRARSESNRGGKDSDCGTGDDRQLERSANASARGTFTDGDTTMMTWASFESPRSLKTKTTDEDSACHGGSLQRNHDEDRETKTETTISQSSRRSRAAAVHNQSERKRRDRINQKMKALQKLVPNASKTDKASMLDEVIEYLKQLQAQVQMMNARNMTPQMMMSLGMQQHHHLQMSLLAARMGMGVGLGMGMGMLDMSTVARGGAPPQSLPPLLHPPPVTAAAAPTFIPTTPFICPPMISSPHDPTHHQDAACNGSVPLPDPYCAFLAQSMNMDLYNKMAAALYGQQVNQTTQQATSTTSPPRSNHVVEAD